MGTVPGGTCPLFGVAADTELVSLLLVDPPGERSWSPVMALTAGVHPHMLGVIEIHITVVCLENLGMSHGYKHQHAECSGNQLFHFSNSPFLSGISGLYVTVLKISSKKSSFSADHTKL
jgi:hypothetical protein